MIRYAIAILMLCLVAQPASAHQQKLAITTIAINERVDRLEIMHQIPAHDAEHALRLQGRNSADIIGSAESRQAFAEYVANRFELVIDGEPISLTFIGSEIEGGTLWVYQDAPVPAPDATIMVNSQILTDVWPRQENRVNFTRGTNVRTVIFGANDGLKQAQFP
ncbi:DUF6702 family protein [Parasphingopyxis sp.]|uniref:DUF6702 family protein n=1 Tax=Parasphingopyxis sp. TaxID=1920299 RepID=UPI00261B2DAB|nr:DUF6702 family protein [Parasphingopyxis sp.]